MDHEKLLQKCAAYGIRGELIAIIRSFLSGRWQRVKVGDVYSDWRRVTSGVPQGSVLGPLLFIIYINDMPDVVGVSQFHLYADDAKLHRARTRTEETAPGLQRDLTTLQLWCQKWQMTINAGKCNLLRIGLRGVFPTQYVLCDDVVQSQTEVNDLGVLVSANLDFSAQCFSIVGKAQKRVGLICRAFSCRDILFMVGMFKTYVRPILEYNCEIWNPLYLGDVDRLERVQRAFTKRIRGLYNLSYEERLEICKLESLEMRRLKRDVVLVYKILNGIINLRFEDYFAHAPVNDRVIRNDNQLKLYPRQCRTNTVLNFFANRVINVWNALPSELVLSPSLKTFKNRLDENSHILYRFLRRANRIP